MNERYRIDFALTTGEPDWQVYTWAQSPEHAAMMAAEAEDHGRYLSRIVDLTAE